MDEKTTAVMEDLYNGNLATKMKNNLKYAATGAFIGLATGIIVASLCGKSRLAFGLLGAVAGGSVGYIVSPSKKQTLDV